MKKIFSFIIIGFIALSSFGCTKNLDNKDILETTTPEEVIQKIDNDISITMGIYTRDSNGFRLVKNEIHLPWNQYKDIIVFKVLATNEEKIDSWYMQDVFPKYWLTYKDINSYKIGYNLSYKVNGKDFSWNIINPEDRMMDVFEYVQLYTYDDVTPKKGTWYDHLDNNEITTGVLMTSIKLCASTYINEIESPMKLTVFAYNDENDFDYETKEYIKDNFYTIYIYKTN